MPSKRQCVEKSRNAKWRIAGDTNAVGHTTTPLLCNRETNWQSRRDREHVRKQKQAQIYEEKMQAARDAKREKTENRRLYVQDKSCELRKAQERKDSVKQVESCIKKKLQMHQSTKLNKVQRLERGRRVDDRRMLRWCSGARRL